MFFLKDVGLGRILVLIHQIFRLQLIYIIFTAHNHVLGFEGESIPIRLFLSPYELTPTHRNINNKFSVKYYLNLVLVDEEDRRYFKQQEITICRLQDS